MFLHRVTCSLSFSVGPSSIETMILCRIPTILTDMLLHPLHHSVQLACTNLLLLITNYLNQHSHFLVVSIALTLINTLISDADDSFNMSVDCLQTLLQNSAVCEQLMLADIGEVIARMCVSPATSPKAKRKLLQLIYHICSTRNAPYCDLFKGAVEQLALSDNPDVAPLALGLQSFFFSANTSFDLSHSSYADFLNATPPTIPSPPVNTPPLLVVPSTASRAIPPRFLNPLPPISSTSVSSSHSIPSLSNSNRANSTILPSSSSSVPYSFLTLRNLTSSIPASSRLNLTYSLSEDSNVPPSERPSAPITSPTAIDDRTDLSHQHNSSSSFSSSSSNTSTVPFLNSPPSTARSSHDHTFFGGATGNGLFFSFSLSLGFSHISFSHSVHSTR